MIICLIFLNFLGAIFECFFLQFILQFLVVLLDKQSLDRFHTTFGQILTNIYEMFFFQFEVI